MVQKSSAKGLARTTCMVVALITDRVFNILFSDWFTSLSLALVTDRVLTFNNVPQCSTVLVYCKYRLYMSSC